MGRPAKVMYVSHGGMNSTEWYGQDIWVDGIGSLKGPQTSPAINYTVTDGGEYSLRCFFAEDTLIYHKYQYSDICDFDSSGVGINEIDAIRVAIYPNPSSSSITITLSQQPQPNTAILIYDVLGRIVRQEELATSTQQISIAELPNGMYTYAITQQGVRQASGKLTIAK